MTEKNNRNKLTKRSICSKVLTYLEIRLRRGAKMTAEVGKWQGHDVLIMTDEQGRKITLGRTKVKAVLDNLEAAKVFCITSSIPKELAKADTSDSLFKF